MSRTFYARGQTGQQLLLGAYQALSKEVASGGVTLLSRRDMVDLVVVDGRARGIVVRDLVKGALETHLGDAVVLATGGYANVFHLSTNARSGNASAIFRAYVRGAAFANPCFVQFHPTCLPVNGEHQAKLTLMSESLRNDGRVWVPSAHGDDRAPNDVPESERDYYLERLYPRYGNLAPRDIASRAAKTACDEGRGVGPGGRGVYLDLADAARRLGARVLAERYENLFEMYERITGDDPRRTPLRIYPAAHYTMGGLWVDYDLMSTVPGLFVIGEANFSDHGANRLGASALMQGLADGYFVLPQTLGGYLSRTPLAPVSPVAPEVTCAVSDSRARIAALFRPHGRRTANDFHRALGRILWESCGLSRNRTTLQSAMGQIGELRTAFAEDLALPGSGDELNQELERAARVADFLELSELMCEDAIQREESCGCHFREEHQTKDGEALRRDERFAHVAVWHYAGAGRAPRCEEEPLSFEAMPLATRSYR